MQVKKKAAKKTYSAAKKGFPKTKITLEDLVALQAKTEAAFKAAYETWAVAHAKTEDAHAKTEAAIQELSAENRMLAAEVRKTSIAVHQLTQNMGGLNNSFGTLVEVVLIPKIRPAINTLGDHSFKEITARKIVETVINDRKRKLTEVDVLLYSDTEAMAVEVKTCLQTSDVDKHLERLQKLRDHEADAEINGKTLFGAVVGAIVHDPIRAYALKKGLYVIEIREEEDKLDIDKPDTCRKW